MRRRRRRCGRGCARRLGKFGGVEALLEELEVGGARGDEGAVADDGDEVFGERVGDAEEVAAGDGAVGVGAGGADGGLVVGGVGVSLL